MELAGRNMGMPSASSSHAAPPVNQMLMQQLQAMIAANPSYLTSGIPNSLISQIVAATALSQQQQQQQQQAKIHQPFLVSVHPALL